MFNVKGLPWVAFTYGFISACGQGIALIPTMTIGMRWFPNQKVVIIMIVLMKTMLMNDDQLGPMIIFQTIASRAWLWVLLLEALVAGLSYSTKYRCVFMQIQIPLFEIQIPGMSVKLFLFFFLLKNKSTQFILN